MPCGLTVGPVLTGVRMDTTQLIPEEEADS